MNPSDIANDPELLELFLRDMERQSDLWKPTNYWKGQCRRMQQQLSVAGLAGFRTNWQLMRGIDLGPKQAGMNRRAPWRSPLTGWLARRLPPTSRYEREIEDVIAAADAANMAHIDVEIALLYQLLRQSTCAATILSKVEDSGIGNPNLYAFDGRRYSSNLLHHVALLALMFRLSGTTTGCRRVVEIGGGYGALPEILVKLQADALDYFVAIDIPPLVYVTTQYLKAVFPGRVVDYREVRSAGAISPADIRGKILVIPPWTVPALRLEYDLFWNSASFQEMEDEVVDNYLEHIGGASRSIFINTLTAGHRQGLGGQLHPISFDKLAREIRAKGFADSPMPADGIERSVCCAVLPRHTAALFTRSRADG